MSQLQTDIMCWGQPYFGQLHPLAWPDNNYDELEVSLHSLPPSTAITGITSATKVVAGEKHTCIQHETMPSIGSGVICWGNHLNGQLGHGRNTKTSSAVSIREQYRPFGDVVDEHGNALRTVKTLDLGHSHGCALADNTAGKRELWCWGDNQNGQLGTSTTSPMTDFAIRVPLPRVP